MSCLSSNSFSNFDPYHNNIGINTINELVADLHRHEDFIGTNRSNILGTTADSVSSQLQGFNSGKNAIVTALSSIANNLISLIDVTVDEYSWCDPDESEYSGPRTIANYPDGVFDHWNWPSIINGIINILQNLLCICTVEIELPPGEDIIFTSRLGGAVPLELIATRGADNNNSVAHSRFINNEGNCSLIVNPRFSTEYQASWTHDGIYNECGAPTFKRVGYQSAIHIQNSDLTWRDGLGGLPQPGDIPFEFVRSKIKVLVEYTGFTIPTQDLTIVANNDLSMNAKIVLNGLLFFEGEISVHDPVFFPQGPPTTRGQHTGTRVTINDWGELTPQDILLHSSQDRQQITNDHSALPLLQPPWPFASVYLYLKNMSISTEFRIKARRPAV